MKNNTLSTSSSFSLNTSSTQNTTIQSQRKITVSADATRLVLEKGVKVTEDRPLMDGTRTWVVKRKIDDVDGELWGYLLVNPNFEEMQCFYDKERIRHLLSATSVLTLEQSLQLDNGNTINYNQSGTSAITTNTTNTFF